MNKINLSRADLHLIIEARAKAGGNIHWVNGVIAVYETECDRLVRWENDPQWADNLPSVQASIADSERRLRIFTFTGQRT